MKGVNRCTFVGALGQDPEQKSLQSGTAVTSFSIACNEQWTDKATGEKKEKAEWINITVFGKLAEIAGLYLKKGSKVYVEGKMRTEKFQDRETGKDRYMTKVVADELVMLDSKPEVAQAPRAAAPASFDDFEDDIPY